MRERQTSNRKNIPFDQRFWPPLNNGIIWGVGTGWKYFVTFFVTFCMQSFLQGKTDKKLQTIQFYFENLNGLQVYICILIIVGDLAKIYNLNTGQKSKTNLSLSFDFNPSRKSVRTLT